jgi:HK97 family phage major capsid protein
MNIAEMIRTWQSKSADLVQRMATLMAAASTGEQRTLSADEQAEYDRIERENGDCQAHIKRLELLEKANGQAATPVAAPVAAVNKAPAVIKRNADDKFQGQSFVRTVIAKTLAKLDLGHPAQIAKERGWDKTNPDLFTLLTRANEIPSHGSATGDYGAELVQIDQRFSGDFIDYLWQQTVFNKLPLREVPANVQIKGMDGVGTASWVGEGRGIGVTVFDFLTVNLTPLKVAALSVMSNEWLRDSSPSGELLIRDGLVNAAGQRIDTTFLSSSAAVAGVSPAGIFNGVTALGSSGWTADNVRDDVRRLLDVFIQARNAKGLHWVMSPSLATALSLMVNSLSSQREFPGVNAETGGTFFDRPVAIGDNIGADVLALVKPSDIYKIGNQGIRVELSRDATVEMSSAPTQDAGSLPPTASTGVNMFTTDSLALKVVLPLNFQKRRTHAAQLISDAQYGETGTVTG